MPNTIEIVIQGKDQATQTFKTVANAGNELKGTFEKIAPAIVGAFAGFTSLRLFDDAIQKTKELGAEVRTLSRETGLGAEDASRFLFVAKELGLGVEELSRSAGIFAKNMVNTRDNLLEGQKATTPFADSMKVLGVAFIGADNQVKPFNEVLLRLADVFQKMPDGPEKTARAMDIFGRSGKDMIPILNLGAQGIKELGAEADKLGVTLTADNAEKIRQFTRSQREFNEAMLGIKLTIGQAVIPALTDFAHWFTEHQSDIRDFVQDAIRTIGTLADQFKTGLSVITDSLNWIPGHKAEVIAAVTAIGVAMAAAFGPESLAFAGLAGIVLALGKLKGTDLGPFGTLGGKKGPSDLAQLYAAQEFITQGTTPQAEAFKAFQSNQKYAGIGFGPAGLQQIAALIAELEAGPAGGQPAPKPPTVPPVEPDLTALVPPVKEALTKLVDVFKEAGDSLRGALSKVDEAISGLFSRPSREQAELKAQLADSNIFKAQFGEKAVHFGPGEGKGTPEKLQRQLDMLDAEHEKAKAHLIVLDQTLKTEAQLQQKTQELADIIPGYTQNIKDAAGALGIDLTPGFQTLTTTASTLNEAMGKKGLEGAVWGAVNALRKLADPNSDTLTPAGTFNTQGELTANPFQGP